MVHLEGDTRLILDMIIDRSPQTSTVQETVAVICISSAEDYLKKELRTDSEGKKKPETTTAKAHPK